MTNLLRYAVWLVAALVAPVPALWGAESGEGAPDVQEVKQLIASQVPGVTGAALDRAAVEGMVMALGTKAILVSGAGSSNTPAQRPLISKTDRLEDTIAYIRVARVAAGLAEGIRAAFDEISSTNRVAGLVLDLRFADGTDYRAAANTANLFLAKAEPLLDWGQGMSSSDNKTNAIRTPLGILVNSSTSGAAEALAGALRSTGVGLILGSQTAGDAFVMRDFPLKTGQILRLASGKVKLGDGTELAPAGIKPDIDVSVSLEDERAYYADAFLVIQKTNLMSATSAGGTNRQVAASSPRRVRFNEAELVRQRMGGRDPEAPFPEPEPEPETPLVSDPALARALDLLKGLAVVRQSRS